MNREQALTRLQSESFDVVVIGGGATGLGVAVDAASRGYQTALVEAHDFAQATSSRSTKLVHGGVRYLQQMDFSLVIEALRERGLMFRNAPHLVHDLAFIIPRYKWWEGAFYGVGLKLYDLLAGRLGIGKTKRLSREETLAAIPNVQQQSLKGGVLYHDGQFDDARMAVALARSADDAGAALANHCAATSFVKQSGRIVGVEAEDRESGGRFQIQAKVVVNATGVFTDSIRRLDDAGAAEIIEPAQGIHLMLDRSFGPGENAIMVPSTTDGRVLFVIPWHDRVIVGTTDTAVDRPHLEPRPLEEEIDFVLENAGRYMQRAPTRADVLSAFAGQRPLVHRGGRSGNTKSISRSHEIFVSDSGLVTITGGKWTTYRKMAEETLSRAIESGGLTSRPCQTEKLHLHGYVPRESAEFPAEEHLQVYGTDAREIRRIADEQPKLAEKLHPRLPYVGAEVAWAARHEMARTLEDVLSRRTRALTLDARASIEAAPTAAKILADELGRDQAWADRELAAYRELARGYLLE